MPCGWEGNRRSGVALAMRHRLEWFIHIRAQGLRKRDKHPAYTRHPVWHTLVHSAGYASTVYAHQREHRTEARNCLVEIGDDFPLEATPPSTRPDCEDSAGL